MIGSIKRSSAIEPLCSSKGKQEHSAKELNNHAEETGVILEKGEGAKTSATYEKPVAKKPDIREVDRLWRETHKATESLRDIVERLISRQGKKIKDVLDSNAALAVDDEARAEMEKAISEDGEWGVKAVSSRIVDFAKALSGGDKSKLAELRAAIGKGFKAAEEALGGTLPSICRETYDEIMKQLDAWEKE